MYSIQWADSPQVWTQRPEAGSQPYLGPVPSELAEASYRGQNGWRNARKFESTPLTPVLDILLTRPDSLVIPDPAQLLAEQQQR